MTREEARKRLRGILTEAIEFENSVCYVTEEDREPLEMAIKALEQEPKTGWIPFTKRPMTEDEELFYEPCCGDAEILDCPLPKDGEDVLITENGITCTDTFIRDETDGCYFEGVDIDDVDAWMPLPKPYEPQESEGKNEIHHYGGR